MKLVDRSIHAQNADNTRILSLFRPVAGITQFCQNLFDYICGVFWLR